MKSVAQVKKPIRNRLSPLRHTIQTSNPVAADVPLRRIPTRRVFLPVAADLQSDAA